MSKSLGNVIAPQTIMKKYGAEILRLWVAAEDYRDDVRMSEEIVKRMTEAYRRLRNTARFLISNLYDFNLEKDTVKNDDLDELDRWILYRTQNLLDRCRKAYENFELHIVYHALNNFCSVDLSAHYLDIVKDRLYCEGRSSKGRRSAQTTIYHILEVLVHLMTPILSFTAEEIWQHLPKKSDAPESILMSQMPLPDKNLIDGEPASRWDQIFKERAEVLKALEEARNANIIGHSLDAKVDFYCDSDLPPSSLRDLFHKDKKRAEDTLIVSQGEFVFGKEPDMLDQLKVSRKSGQRGTWAIANGPDGSQICIYDSEPLNCYIAVSKADGQKCERCWKYDKEVGQDSVHPTVCGRCSEVLRSGVPT